MPSSSKPPVKLRGTKTPNMSRFHRMAVREGGISRDEAIKKVDTYIAKMQPTYFEWLRDDMTKLENAIQSLSSGSHEPREWEQAYRISCNVRDLGSTFGYYGVTDVADSLCELLKRLEYVGLFHQPAIDVHMTALRLVGTTSVDSRNNSEQSRLIDGLSAIVDKFPRVGAPRDEDASKAKLNS